MEIEKNKEEPRFDTLEDIDAYICRLEDAEILELCKDIYDWKYVSGVIVENSRLKKLRERISAVDASYLADVVVREAAVRFHDVVVLLLSEEPNEFLKFK